MGDGRATMPSMMGTTGADSESGVLSELDEAVGVLRRRMHLLNLVIGVLISYGHCVD